MRIPFTLTWWLRILCLFLLTTLAIRAQGDGARRWAFSTLSTASAGNILSSPAVAPDGTIYIGVEVGLSTSTNASGRLFALQPNGAQKWEFTAPDWVDSTPAIGADGTIYFGCWNGVLYALRPDGTKRWELKLGSFIASSPALGADGTIYVGAGSELMAVNPNGTLKWFFPAADWVDSSPAVAPDGSIYVGSWDGNLYALAPDGTERWRFETDGDVVSSPALGPDGSIYFGSRDLHVYALARDGTLLWSIDTSDTVETSPALGADGTIYVATTGGRVYAFRADGTERWRYPRDGQPALNAIYSSPAVRGDGSIVFGSSNDGIYALRPDGTLLWRTPLEDWSDSSPVVTDDAIYLGAADKRLYSFFNTAGRQATAWPQFRRDARRTGWTPMGVAAGTSGRLINLSVRTFAGSDAQTLIVGFFVGGTESRSLLVRGVGPSLVGFGVSGVLDNPRITARAGQAMHAENDDWSDAHNASAIVSTTSAVGGFPLPAGSRDAALLGVFPSGAYTVQVRGAGESTGVALMEAYDAGGGNGARLLNISARSLVNPGAGVLIAGFVINQNTRAVLVRGVGPTLGLFGVTGTLANPQLRVFQGTQLVAENDDWSTASNAAAVASAAASVGAFALPQGSPDAAILLTLPPNAYTVQVSGANSTSGVALVEVYELQ